MSPLTRQPKPKLQGAPPVKIQKPLDPREPPRSRAPQATKQRRTAPTLQSFISVNTFEKLGIDQDDAIDEVDHVETAKPADFVYEASEFPVPVSKDVKPAAKADMLQDAKENEREWEYMKSRSPEYRRWKVQQDAELQKDWLRSQGVRQFPGDLCPEPPPVAPSGQAWRARREQTRQAKVRFCQPHQPACPCASAECNKAPVEVPGTESRTEGGRLGILVPVQAKRESSAGHPLTKEPGNDPTTVSTSVKGATSDAAKATAMCAGEQAVEWARQLQEQAQRAHEAAMFAEARARAIRSHEARYGSSTTPKTKDGMPTERDVSLAEVVFPVDTQLNIAEIPRYLILKVVLDSGAGAHVINRKSCPGYEVTESEMSRAGCSFRGADGGKIANHGQVLLNLLAPDSEGHGHKILSKFEVADVTRALWSVGLICDSGLKVTFSKTNAYIKDPEDNELCVFTRSGEQGLYIADVKIQNPNHPDFQRPGR